LYIESVLCSTKAIRDAMLMLYQKRKRKWTVGWSNNWWELL